MLNLFRKKWEPAPAPLSDRSWAAVAALFAQCRALADKHSSTGHDFTVFIHGNAEVSVTLKRKGNEFNGRGRDPWAAVADMCSGSRELAEQLDAILPKQES